MNPYSVSTSFSHDPELAVSLTVMAASEAEAVQKVLHYLQLEFDLPPDAGYFYRAS